MNVCSAYMGRYGNYVCTLAKGHGGQHVAHDPHDNVLATEDQED